VGLTRCVRFTNPFTDMGHRPERKQTSTAPAGDQCRCPLRRPGFLAVFRSIPGPASDTAATCHPRSSRAYPVRTATGLFVIAPAAAVAWPVPGGCVGWPGQPRRAALAWWC